MKELFNITDTIVLWSIIASIVSPVIFLTLGRMKTTDVRKYVKSLRTAYMWFAVYGLIRWLML